jgi:hypothetical protein
MIELKNPPALIKELENYGVTLQPQISYDPKTSLLEVQSQFNGEEYSPMGAEADFGLFASIIGKKWDRKLKKAGKGVIKVAKFAAPIAAFAIPGVNLIAAGGIAASLAAGDKFLGSKKVSKDKKQQVINNTKALAALGDKDAKNGLLILNAARKVRVQKRIPLGKPAIVHPNTSITVKPAPVSAVRKVYTKSTVLQLAQNVKLPSLTVWMKVKKFLGFKV